MIKEVLWTAHLFNWIKSNIEGASVGTPNIATSKNMFRDHNANHLDKSAYFLGNRNALFVEFMRVILAIDHAISSNWLYFWWKIDSMLAVRIITKPIWFLLKIRNIWDNCILDLK